MGHNLPHVWFAKDDDMARDYWADLCGLESL